MASWLLNKGRLVEFPIFELVSHQLGNTIRPSPWKAKAGLPHSSLQTAETNMNYCKSLVVTFLTLLFGGALAGLTPAQHAALTTNPSGNPFFQSVALNSLLPKQMDFSLKRVGSVKGRVFSDEELSAAANSGDSFGISGVKVTLRSRDKGFDNFAFEQYTDVEGSYIFLNLRPGNYTIEVDPNTLPTHFKSL